MSLRECQPPRLADHRSLPQRTGRRRLRIERLEDRLPLAAGDLDVSLGIGGIVNINSCPQCNLDQVIGVGVQADGRIVAAGSRTNPGSDTDFVVARLMSDGSLDTSFGSGGFVDIDFGGRDIARDMEVLGDGKIVIMGAVEVVGQAGDFGVARLNADGSLDSSFGGGGRVTTSFEAPQGGVSDDQPVAMTIDSNGRSVVIGRGNNGNYTMSRYLTSGFLDSSFGSGGRVYTTLTFATDIVSTSNGYVVVGGNINLPGQQDADFFLTGYDFSGMLDSGFGSGGFVATDINPGVPGSGGSRSALVLDNGDMLVVGNYIPNNSGLFAPRQFAVVRYEPNGSLDPFLGGTGIVFTSFSPTAVSTGGAIAVQADGKFIVSGSNLDPSTFGIGFALARYNADGSLDDGSAADTSAVDSFGVDGLVTTATGANGFEIALQADQRILVAGNVPGSLVMARYDNEGPPEGDDDGDGVSNADEDAHPDPGSVSGPHVDPNLPFSQQPNVVALPSAVDGRYVTLVATTGNVLTDVTAVDSGAPGGTTTPLGSFEFNVTVPSAGDSETVTIYLPPGATDPIDSIYKFGPSDFDPLDHWYQFTIDPTDGSGAEAIDVNGDGQLEWQVHLIDGGRGDHDLTSDAVIHDPVTLARGGLTPGRVIGTVFHDANFNSQLDTISEVIGAGWSVFVDTNRNGVLDSGEPLSTTDSDGHYEFDNLPRDTNFVQLVPQAGWDVTLPVPWRAVDLPGSLATSDLVATGDINSDGIPDVVAGNIGNDSMQGWLGDGNGEFQVDGGWFASELDTMAALKLADLDGQNGIDVIAAGRGNVGEAELLVYRNTGQSANDRYSDVIKIDFGDARLIDVEVADVDGQNGPDLIASVVFSDPATLDRVHVLLNNGDGTFAAPALASVNLYSGQLAVGDWDEDGDIDIASGSRGFAGIDIHLNDGTGQFTFSRLITDYDNPNDLLATDISGDGVLDLVVADADMARLTMLVNNPSGPFNGGVTYYTSISSPATALAAGDFDGDNVADVVARPALEAELWLLSNDGGGQLRPTLRLENDRVSGSVVAEDFNQDGRPDLVVDNFRIDGATVLLNEPTLMQRLRLGDQATRGANFGVLLESAAKVQGTVYDDSNGNGVRDIDAQGNLESLITTGWSVFLDIDDDGVRDPSEPLAVTDTSGEFSFNVVPGNYTLRQLARTGWEQTSPANGAGFSLSLQANDFLTGYQFGVVRSRGTVTGTVWQDLDGSGTRDAGEPPLENWEVFVDLDGDRLHDAGEESTQTDASGQYSFLLEAGTYDIVQVLGGLGSVVWQQTFPDPAGGLVHDDAVVQTLQTTVADFGNRGNILVSGAVWNDINADGIQNANEPALANQIVFADRNENGFLNTNEPFATTAADGSYELLIAPTPSLTTVIGFQRPVGYEVIHPDSAADGNAYRVETFEEDPGLSFPGANFGIRQVQADDVRGVVWIDHDGNGIRDIDELGRAGAVVYLDADGDGRLSSGDPARTTNASGRYVFGDPPNAPNSSAKITVARLQNEEPWWLTSAVAGVGNRAHTVVGELIDVGPSLFQELPTIVDLNPLVDAYPDLYFESATGLYVQLSGGPARSLMPPVLIASDPHAVHAVPRHVNGETLLDFAVVTLEASIQRITVYVNDGAGNYQVGDTGLIDLAAFDPLNNDIDPDNDRLVPVGGILDANGDGIVDMMIQIETSQTVELIILNGSLVNGNLTFPTLRSQVVGHIHDVAGPFDIPSQTRDSIVTPMIVDMNADGSPDIIGMTFSSDRLMILENNGNGTFAAAQFHRFSSGGLLSADDFDGDGDIDLTLTNQRDNFTRYGLLIENRGNNNFDEASFISHSSTFAAVDVNHDGMTDLVGVGGGLSREIFVQVDDSSFPSDLRLRDARFVRALTTSAGNLVADFDGDGLSDLLIRSEFDPQFILYANGLVTPSGLNFGTVQLCDGDADAQSDLRESMVPFGDGNGDGIPDADQANVTSLASYDGSYVTLTAPNGTKLVDVHGIPNPAPNSTPSGAQFPLGFFSFAIEEETPGALAGPVVLDMVLHDPQPLQTFYKYGPTTTDTTDHWYLFAKTPLNDTGAELINEDSDPGTIERIRLHFVDGGRGDADLTSNGRIIDPGGPALLLNTPPVATIQGPASGVRGQTQSFFVSASDADVADATAGFTYEINFNDGSPPLVVSREQGNGDRARVDHVFPTAGMYTISVVASDQAGNASEIAAHTIDVAVLEVQPDLLVPSHHVLVVGGTMSDDSILFWRPFFSRSISVSLNGALLGRFSDIDRVEAFGQDGDDTIAMLALGVAAKFHGGNGNDYLAGGLVGDALLLGGPGDDHLIGSQLGRNLLIGGGGSDHLQGGSLSQNLLIGGSTIYDDQDAALLALMAEWTSHRSLSQRVTNLLVGGGLNGQAVLSPGTTIIDDGEVDDLFGGLSFDWFFKPPGDVLHGRQFWDRVNR